MKCNNCFCSSYLSFVHLESAPNQSNPQPPGNLRVKGTKGSRHAEPDLYEGVSGDEVYMEVTDPPKKTPQS